MRFLKKFITCTKVSGYTRLHNFILLCILIILYSLLLLGHLKAHFACESHLEDIDECITYVIIVTICYNL